MSEETEMPAEKPQSMKINAKKFNLAGSVVIDGEINNQLGIGIHSQFDTAVQSALKLNRNHVQLIIDSYGGSTNILSKIISAMQIHRPNPEFKYVGFAAGACYSSAFILLQHCDWRVALNSSTFLCHYGNVHLINSSFSALLSDRETFLDIYSSMASYPFDAVIRRSGQSFETLKRLADINISISAKSALEYNFIDEIIDCVPEKSTKVDLVLGFK
ncbi:hypothetical protein EBU91_02355 [bacterium]|nr:hypothetical protein [bacterium]